MNDHKEPVNTISVGGDIRNSKVRQSVVYIQNFYAQHPWFAVVSVLIVLAAFAAGFILLSQQMRYDTSPMSGSLTVVVAPFFEEKHGQLKSSKEGLILAQYFYAQLEHDIASGEFEKETGIQASLRAPQKTIPLRSVNQIGIDQSAGNLASQINAHVVIYGILRYDEWGRPSLALRFYAAPQQFGDAQEILGENELGSPILLMGDIESGRDLESENEELRNRLQVTSLVMKAIGAYVGEDFETSLDYLERALAGDLWKQTSGQEVIYVLAGNALSRQALPLLLQEDETSSLEAIRLAEEYYRRAIESAAVKGEYARAYIGLAGVENFYATYKAKLTTNLADIDMQAIEREEEYLDKASAASYRPATADIPEKVAFHRALVYYLRSQMPAATADDLEEARTNYQFVIDAYEAGNIRLRELAAHSYSGLGFLAYMQGDLATTIALYHKALETSHIPSLQGMYLSQLGNVYFYSCDWINALKSYTAALEMKVDLSKRLTAAQIQEIEDKIDELQKKLSRETTTNPGSSENCS